MPKLILLLPVLCIIFNTLPASGDMGGDIVSGKSVSVRSSVDGLSAACLAAIDAVKQIIVKNNPLTAQFKQRSDKHNRDDLSFRILIVPLHLKLLFSLVQQHFPWFDGFSIIRDVSRRTNAPPGMNSCFLLLLLSFLVVLSQSKLPWEFPVVLRYHSTRPASTDRVFHFWGKGQL